MSDLQKKEFLSRYLTDVQLDFILSACCCSLSEVRVIVPTSIDQVWFPYLSLTSVDLEKIVSFGHWFVLDSDFLCFDFSI